MRKVAIYTDGACRGNPGPGGWGVSLRYNGTRKDMHGGELQTTNNRMELQAVIEALRSLRIVRYAAWLTRRWEDPAFPRAFPWFDSPRYWEEHILTLREQAAAMDEPLVL